MVFNGVMYHLILIVFQSCSSKGEHVIDEGGHFGEHEWGDEELMEGSRYRLKD